MINEAMINLNQVGTKALSTAIGILGTRLVAVLAKPHGRRAEDLSTARWFETYKLTRSFPQLPDLSPELAPRLAELLSGEAIQATLQELLAVRLTDADNVEAGRARDAFCLTLSSSDPELTPYGPLLVEYYDDQISELVARLEAADPAVLTQVRSEALSARSIAILRAIERHTAALNARPNLRTEASFLASYRGHVLDHHGKLEPPDFDRRLRVPISAIYVPPTIFENTYPERAVAAVPKPPPTLSVWELAERVDRTVLLGDPGGGKTTASNVLMYHFASDEGRRVPYLVTLRNYASAYPPEQSVVGYIERELETFYQCPAPPGLVEMLLLTGRAVVFFDGLDELLDTSRRADISSRIEQFCREYPLAPVLVTSRVVGYDQARLDETQFASYRLGGFRDQDVAEYAHKWFALEEGARANEADAFLTESQSVPDLRTNPLLLSLMCILYRGEGSLPRNRAEVYEQCAKLLFNRWDAHRHIHQELRAGRYVEQILRHLAWWLFTRDSTQTSVAEYELVATTTEFLHGRGFESRDDAREAAQEFIEFCRGRLWVFSDAGTTASGEKLYAFTHRTFLEYFAACQLAYDCDTPERLARAIAPHISRGEWEVVCELAVQIKDATSREGARRIYDALLDERRRRSTEGRNNILQFLARALRSVDPFPEVIRRLTRNIISNTIETMPDGPSYGSNPLSLATDPMGGAPDPLGSLITSCASCGEIVREEARKVIGEFIESGEARLRINALRLTVSLTMTASIISHPTSSSRTAWIDLEDELVESYASAIPEAAAFDLCVLTAALRLRIVSLREVLATPGGLTALLSQPRNAIYPIAWGAHLESLEGADLVSAMADIGDYLRENPQVPWASTSGRDDGYIHSLRQINTVIGLIDDAYLGCVAIEAILVEADERIMSLPPKIDEEVTMDYPAAIRDFGIYATQRIHSEHTQSLPELPVPDGFKQVFRDWAEGKVNFTAPGPKYRAWAEVSGRATGG